MHFLSTFAALAGAAGVAEAMLVAQGSPCVSSCGNVLDSTTEEDLVCDQSDYEEVSGELFRTCTSCELQSGYANNDESDVQWLLYNLRYATSYCLFNFPEHEDALTTPCYTSEACGAFESAIRFENLTSDVDAYDYCALWPVTDEKHFQQCTACLQSGGQEYMANFVTVLQAGCQQQPDDGVTVAVDGDVFSTDHITVAEPSPRVTVDPSWFDEGPLGVASIAGIVSGGIVVVLVIAGCCIVWRGKRRRRAFLRNFEAKNQSRAGRGWPSPAQPSNMKEVSDTPLSQRPLREWDDSPMTTRSEQQPNFPRYFSPYSSQYNSPVSAVESQQLPWPALTPQYLQHMQQQQQLQQQKPEQHQQQHAETTKSQSKGKSIGLAFGGDDVSVSSESQGKGNVEAYEMQDVDRPEHQHATPQPDQEPAFTHTHSRTYSGSYRDFGGERMGEL